MSPDRSASHPPIALTMGEPAGIGGEITLKSWVRRKAHGLSPFFAIDDPERLRSIADRHGFQAEIEVIEEPGQALHCFSERLPVLPLSTAVRGQPGRPESGNAALVLESIDRAVDLCLTDKAAAMVTNPIHKQVLYEAGFRHPGHTEYLAERSGSRTPPVMMLTCPGLRVVPVTIHVSLKQATESLTGEMIVDCGRITAQALATDFGLSSPRLVVAGLNPHAGEGGAMGREELDIIAPAVEKLRQLGVDARGPLPADSLFHTSARDGYDAALCMYHDQALIPLKTIDFERGVNITLGLPIVRTSPDHGTALNIAGTGKASEASLIAALQAAETIARNRRHDR